MEKGHSGLLLSTFFVFSHARRRRSDARGFDLASSFVFAFHSSAKWLNSACG